MVHPFPFLFLGAGEAAYFERAEVHVRFARAARPGERRKIAAAVPVPLRDARTWEDGDRQLMVASGQVVHRDMKGAAATKERRFNAEIDAWLAAAHAIVPIAYAYRGEDGEAGGTELSRWHTWSVQQLRGKLGAIVALAARGNQASFMARGILRMAVAARHSLDARALDVLDPSRPWKRALDAGNGGRSARALDGTDPQDHDVLVQAVALERGAHRRALAALCGRRNLPSALRLPVAAAAADEGAPGAARMLAALRRAGRRDPEIGAQLGRVGYALIAAKRWRGAVAVFDVALDLPEVDLSVYCNALCAVQRANNRMPLDRPRLRRFLGRALPYAPRNPSIFHNAVGCAFELGDHALALRLVDDAGEHGYSVVKIRKDPSLAGLFGRPAR